MIARVALEIALRREFDYLVPDELRELVDEGTRVKVPFGHRKVLGVVTAVRDDSPHTNLKSIEKVIGGKSLVTPRVLELARWIADYYCCPLETALKSVLPESVRREKDGWKKQLFARALPLPAEMPKLTKKQEYVWTILEEWRELPMQELIRLGETTADTIRRLEDKGLLLISSQTMERDPYANEHILPTTPLVMNDEQAKALSAILAALGDARPAAGETLGSRPAVGSTLQRAASGSLAEECLAGRWPAVKCGEAPTSMGTALQSSPFFQPDLDTTHYSGWLPHWRQTNRLYFVTYRQADSVAQDTLKQWQQEKRLWLEQHPKPWTGEIWSEYHERFTDLMERYLDAGRGECLLQRAEASALVEASLKHFDGERYQLGAYVIMPNHVHVLVRPASDWPLEKILQTWKSFTAKELNKLAARSGTVWMEEYFDHLVRSVPQLAKYEGYIRENPERAGLREGTFRLGRGSFSFSDARPAAGETLGCRQAVGSTLQRAASGSLTEEGLAGRWPAVSNPQTPPPRSSAVFLLHGVTGSGKTEVYLQAIARCLEQGKGAIVLVPEISLTPQTVERFKARFSSGPLRTLVAVLHSHLSAGEKHDEWHKIRQGRAQIVIGARSAIFAPDRAARFDHRR